jgi:hypothetical protein
VTATTGSGRRTLLLTGSSRPPTRPYYSPLLTFWVWVCPGNVCPLRLFVTLSDQICRALGLVGSVGRGNPPRMSRQRGRQGACEAGRQIGLGTCVCGQKRPWGARTGRGSPTRHRSGRFRSAARHGYAAAGWSGSTSSSRPVCCNLDESRFGPAAQPITPS